jgi:hypothetical protein
MMKSMPLAPGVGRTILIVENAPYSTLVSPTDQGAWASADCLFASKQSLATKLGKEVVPIWAEKWGL